VDATRAIVWVIMLAKANERRQKMLDVKARVVVVMVTDRQTVDDLYHARRHAAREARGGKEAGARWAFCSGWRRCVHMDRRRKIAQHAIAKESRSLEHGQT
jgi:hypothetical protein